MPFTAEDVGRIDAALRSWRQGDVALGPDLPFVHVADLARPLTAVALDRRIEAVDKGEEPGLDAVVSGVEGVVVTTQTCDVVRSARDRPYVEVAPLVAVDAQRLGMVRKGLLPAYAYIPGVAEHGLAADLDRTATVEKAVVASWHRVPGWRTDQEARLITQALVRKRGRPAFPDEFVVCAEPLRRRILKKHGNRSVEGRFLEALSEIRVQASPDWATPPIDLRFWFIKADDPVGVGTSWADQADAWVKLVERRFPFRDMDFVVCRLEDMTAADYVGSDRLDLDHLSH